MLQLCLLRALKGDVGVCVRVWSRSTAEAAAEVSRVLNTARLLMQHQSWGIRAVEKVLVQQARGLVGVCVRVWVHASADFKRSQMQAEEAQLMLDMHTRKYQKHAALISKMAVQQQTAGMKMVEQILVRMSRGEAGLAMHVWTRSCRAAEKAHREELRVAACQGVIANRGTERQLWALQMFSRILIELLKGELGLGIYNWSRSTLVAAESTIQDAAINKRRNTATRRLKAVLERAYIQSSRGVSGLCVYEWVKASAAAKQKDEHAAMAKGLLLEKYAWGSRAFEQTIVRMVRGQMALNIHDWRRACVASKQQLAEKARSASMAEVSALFLTVQIVA